MSSLIEAKVNRRGRLPVEAGLGSPKHAIYQADQGVNACHGMPACHFGPGLTHSGTGIVRKCWVNHAMRPVRAFSKGRVDRGGVVAWCAPVASHLTMTQFPCAIRGALSVTHGLRIDYHKARSEA